MCQNISCINLTVAYPCKLLRQSPLAILTVSIEGINRLSVRWLQQRLPIVTGQ